jgi:hypothetical protein
MTAKDQLLFDLFTTALEGGIGYWSECEAYHWMIGPPADDVERPSEPDLAGFYARIREIDYDLDMEIPRTINRDVMLRGFSRASTPPWRDRINWSSGEKPPLIIDGDTDWDFDAGDADCIVQLGLFGEVIYG